MKELTSLDLYFLMKEFQSLVHSKINKVFQDESVIIQTHSASMGKRYIRILLPSMIYFSESKTDIEESGKFALSMRKHIKNTIIREIRQVGFERIIEFKLDAKEKQLSLYVELFKPGNIILCEEGKVLMGLTYKGFGSRMIRPGIVYEHPSHGYNLLELDDARLKELLEKTDKENIVKTLATDLGLGGNYAELLCRMSKIDKNVKGLSEKERKDLLDSIREVLSLFPHGYEGESPIGENKKTETYNELLDSIYTIKQEQDRIDDEESKIDKKRKQIESIIKQQEMMIKGLERSIEESQKKGETVYANYVLIEGILKELEKARKKYTLAEMKEKLKGHDMIKELNEKEKRVTLEL
jgi:predicted ribosome quality control (RQC) complex YloA/Tae2 family protein